MKHYSEYRHPDYVDKVDKENFAWDHYTGDYVDSGNITNYLWQKPREANKSYEYRRKDFDPIMHFATAVDSINGIIAAKAKDIERTWGDLGDPEEEGDTAHTLWHNADGDGTNWSPLMKEVGIRLTVMHRIWGLVEGVQEDGDGVISEGVVKIINPQSVVNWWPRQGNPEQVLVKESRDVRQSITAEPDVRDVFTLYELDGWKRFYVEDHKDDAGNPVTSEVVLDSDTYNYYASSKRRTRILPIFFVEIPMPRFVGYHLALKQNHIFNFKSSRDFGSAILSFAILKIVGTGDEYKSIIAELEEGANAIRQDPESAGAGHQFFGPPGDHLQEAGNILEKDTEHFYLNAFKEYGDAAAQRTATEIRLESKTGIEAFLALLVSSVDEFENNCLFRLMQVYFPDRPQSWGTAYVKRPTDFSPTDEQEALEKMMNRAFGERDPAPLPVEAMRDIIKRWLDKHGIEAPEDDDIEAVIRDSAGMLPPGQVGG